MKTVSFDPHPHRNSWGLLASSHSSLGICPSSFGLKHPFLCISSLFLLAAGLMRGEAKVKVEKEGQAEAGSQKCTRSGEEEMRSWSKDFRDV